MRGGLLDVLCCHLVLLLRHGLVYFSGNEVTKAPKFWNSYWYALLNRCIYDTWTIFPGTKQLNLFSHNGSLHPCSWLAKLWPSTLEAPGLNPNWLGNKMPLWASFYSSHLAKVLLACLLLQEERFDLNALPITSALREDAMESESFIFFQSSSLKLSKTAAIFFWVAQSDASEFSLPP